MRPLSHEEDDQAGLIILYCVRYRNRQIHLDPTTVILASFIGRDGNYTYNLLRKMERRGLISSLKRILYGGRTLWEDTDLGYTTYAMREEANHGA